MFIWLIVIAGVIFLDQLTQYLALMFLRSLDTVPLWEDVLHLTYVENPGAAFGMMKDQRWIFMTVSTVAIVALLVYLLWKKPQSKVECLAVAFIIGGGIGNMIDRVALGYVVDMIDFRLIDFAVFNVADSFVCVGAGLLVLWLLLSCIKEYRIEKEARLAMQEGAELEECAGPFDEAPETDALSDDSTEEDVHD